MTNHLRDTKTKRYYFDRAFLSVLPDASGFKLTSAGAGGARATVSKKTSTYTLLQLNLGRRIYSGKTNDYRLVFDLVDAGGAASRDVRVGTSLVSFPVWAFATDSTPGSSVKVTFPAGYEVAVESGEIPAPETAADGTTTLETGKLDKPLTFFAYLVGDRPGSYAERIETATINGSPIELTIRGWADDAAVGRPGRQPGLARPPRPGPGDRSALAAPGRSRLPRDGQPEHRRVRRVVRSVARPGRGGLRRRRFRRPPRIGAHLVQRRTAHRPLGERGVRVVLRPRGGQGTQDQGQRRHPDPGARGGPHPAQRVGCRRPREREDRGLRLRGDRSPSPARSPSVPVPTACALSGQTPRGRSGRTSRS